jgi:hypothetical protein
MSNWCLGTRAVLRMKSYVHSAVVISLVGVLCGCSSGKPPFLMVQVCLRDEQNLALFTNTLKSIAQAEHMNYLDNSAVTQNELASIYRKLKKANPNGLVINIGVVREDGMGLSAGNLGLPTYQVALGFSEGSSSSEAHRFADLVVGALGQTWQVEIVPNGQGALPMKTCGR